MRWNVLLGRIALGVSMTATVVPLFAVDRLLVGDVMTRELTKASADRFEIVADAGQYVRAVVEERRANVDIRVSDPGGKQVLAIAGSKRTHAFERISFIAPVSGAYVVTITPKSVDTDHGRYELRLEIVRTPLPEDCSRLEAEEAWREGQRLNQKGSADSLKAAAGKYTQAVGAADQAGDVALKAEALASLGSVQNARGELRQGLDAHAEAFQLALALKDESLQALELYHIGTLHGLLGENRRAFGALTTGLAIARHIEDRSLQAALLNALAVRYKDVGEMDTALSLYNQSLALERSTGDYENPTLLNNLGNLYHELGRWQEALQHYHEALPMWRKAGYRRGEAATLYNIGLVYQEEGDSRRALVYFRKALSLSRESGNRSGEGISLYRIGSVSEDLGDLDEALARLNEALVIYRSIGDPRREAVARTCIGRIHARRGEYDQAFAEYDRALPIARAAAYRWGEAFTLKHLGDIWANCGSPLRAMDYYNEALAGFESMGREIWEASTLVAMAEAYDAAGDIGAARTTVDRGLEKIEHLQANVTSQELKATYLSSVRHGYELSIDVLMRLHLSDRTKGFDKAALHVSERARARSFLDQIRESGAGARRGADAALLRRQRELRQTLTAKVEQQARQREGSPRSGASDAASTDVASLTDELEEIERKIRASNPHYAAATDRLLHADEIQKLLDPETLLLEYTLGEKRSFLWVVSQTMVASYVLPPRNAIEPPARRLIELLAERPTAVRTKVSIDRAARELTGMLLLPAAERLSAKRLVIVSDGILHYIPFAALPLWTHTTTPLITRYEVVSVPSASSLAALREQLATRSSPSKELAVLADPVFRRNDARVAAHFNAPDGVLKRAAASKHRDAGVNAASLPRLPYTRREAKAILELVPPRARKEAFDFAASRATAMDGSLAQYRVVHFATHGFFNTAHPELSGIVLSLVDARGRDQDGFLLTSDVMGMTLTADLVVLSGCRTALGREVYSEGLTGLSRAFLFAGAARVVASLWKVDDAATAELMTQFYRRLFLQKASPSAALRGAQMELRKQERWASPYYWAGFVMQGDWK
ncbi:MAG TPA: CHAT domain-containing tetratricopeptide repeat protein [Thermoanaerobaculia bacterium]